MTCDEHRRALESAAVAADTEALPEAVRHAERCPECAAEARSEQELRRALQQWPDCDPPAGLAQRALARCFEETATRAPRRPTLRAPWWAIVPVTSALAAGAWLMITRPSMPTTSRRPAPQEARALAALRRAADRVVLAQVKSENALARVLRARRLPKENL